MSTFTILFIGVEMALLCTLSFCAGMCWKGQLDKAEGTTEDTE